MIPFVLVPLVTITALSVTGDELFDLFFTVVLYFVCLILPLAGLASLFRLFVLIGVISLFGLAGSAEALSVVSSVSVDCPDGCTVVFTAGPQLASQAGVRVGVSVATKSDRSDEVDTGRVQMYGLGGPVVFRAEGYLRFWNPAGGGMPDNYPGCGDAYVCVSVTQHSGAGFSRRFWMAGAGLVCGALLGMGVLRGFA
jgi:hypothetical protein